ncbi:hypothetical protein Tco_1173275 [Tanacetum coccineum]
MAIPEDHLAKFHKMTDAKDMWNAIKSRFGGNDESKKMQKYILKQQFEGFTVSNTDGIHKGYERFQSLLSQLEIHGAVANDLHENKEVSTEELVEKLQFLMQKNLWEQNWKKEESKAMVTVDGESVDWTTHSGDDENYAFMASNSSGSITQREELSYARNQMSMLQPKVWSDDLIMRSYVNQDIDDEYVLRHFAREYRTKEDNRRRDGWNTGNKDRSRTGKKEESKALVTVDGETVQTRTGINPVNTAKASGTNNFSTARQNVNRQTVLTSTVLKVNTVKPIVNGVRPANVFHKTHSPSSRPFKRTTVLKTNFSNQKVYTAKVKQVSTVGVKWDTAVKASAGCVWRTKGYNNNILSIYNGGSSLRNCSTLFLKG